MIPIKTLIVGAGLVAYGCAYSALRDGSEVFIADHSTEFGLPNIWPSLVENRYAIPLDFETERGFEGNEMGFRHEWIMKSMNIELAKKGVILLNKTRIVSSTNLPQGILVHLKGASQIEGEHTFDAVIDATNDTWIPWSRAHDLSAVSIRYDVKRKLSTGYLHLDTEVEKFSDADLQLERYDGTIESWYSEHHESSNTKILEIMPTKLPIDRKMWSCDQRFLKGMGLWNELMELTQ